MRNDMGGAPGRLLATVVLALAATGPVFADPAPSDSVTVTGKRAFKPCAEKDEACILAVAKEVWARYPQQIQKFCNGSIIEKQREFMTKEEVLPSAWGPDMAGDYEIAPALKAVCDYKPDKLFDRSVPTWAPWAGVPSAADVAAVYPKGALGLSAGGDAKLNCRIDEKGRLGHCTVSEETPDRKGFGSAALKLAGKFMARTDPAAPTPVRDGWVDIAVHFDNPGAAATTPPQIVHPDWVALPEPARTQSLFPAAASQAGVQTGVGRVDCRVGEDGGLGDCALVSEEPAGLGFGASALAAAPDLHANLWSRDGLRTPGAHVVVPLRFNAAAPAVGQKSGG
jgi:TonB family protein